MSGTPIFVALLVAGLVLRVLVYRTTWSQPDGDQTMGMLMAYRASQGHLSLIFWGGNYGGALISWIEAPLVSLFGLQTWVFTVVDSGLTLIAVFLLRAIGLRTVSGMAANVAAGTYWFFPALWLFWSSREYVFWLPAIVFALATCLFVLRWFADRTSTVDLWLAGLCAGLAIWSYPLVACLIAPALVVLLWAIRRDIRSILGLAVAALVGVSPWLAYFAINGSAAFHLPPAGASKSANLVHSVSQVLPMALRGGQFRLGVIWGSSGTTPGVLTALGVAVYAAAVVFTVVSAVRREVALAAIGATVVIWPPVLVAGNVILGTATFRYAVVIVPPILLIAAHLLSKIRLTVVLPVIALVSVVTTLWSDTSGFAAVPTCDPTLTTTGADLVAQHRDAVWAAYWIAGPLQVCSDGRLTASSVAPVRDVIGESAALDAPRSTYVVTPNGPLDQQLTAWTKANGVPAKVTQQGGFTIWTFDHRINPAQMGLNGGF